MSYKSYFSYLLFLFTTSYATAEDFRDVKPFIASNGFGLMLITDQMEDTVTLTVAKQLSATDEAGKLGAVIVPIFKFGDEEIWEYNGLLANLLGGTCHENSSLLFLFEDDTKATARQWSDYTCDKTVSFDLSNQLLDKAKDSPIKGIRTRSSNLVYTFAAQKEPDKNYFLNVIQALSEYNQTLPKKPPPKVTMGRTDEADRLGLIVKFIGQRVIVERVVGDPALTALIKPGDEILRVSRSAVTADSYYTVLDELSPGLWPALILRNDKRMFMTLR